MSKIDALLEDLKNVLVNNVYGFGRGQIFKRIYR